jgi:hypothetical protein
MPHQTFPLSREGMIVAAVVGLNGVDTASLVQHGRPIPRPIQVRSLLDSGTDVTAVAARVFQQLGLGSLISGFSQTTSGLVSVNLYRVSLTISCSPGLAGPIVTLTDLLVSELTTALPNIDALIGMDVLRESLLVLDGPVSVLFWARDCRATNPARMAPTQSAVGGQVFQPETFERTSAPIIPSNHRKYSITEMHP